MRPKYELNADMGPGKSIGTQNALQLISQTLLNFQGDGSLQFGAGTASNQSKARTPGLPHGGLYSALASGEDWLPVNFTSSP
jgi:hypothetical protein